MEIYLSTLCSVVRELSKKGIAADKIISSHLSINPSIYPFQPRIVVNLLFLTTVLSLEITPRFRTKSLLTATKDTSYMGQLKDDVKRMVLGVAFRPLAKVIFSLLKDLSLITYNKKNIREREDKGI